MAGRISGEAAGVAAVLPSETMVGVARTGVCSVPPKEKRNDVKLFQIVSSGLGEAPSPPSAAAAGKAVAAGVSAALLDDLGDLRRELGGLSTAEARGEARAESTCLRS